MICIIEMNKISNSSNEMRDLKSLEKKKQKHLSMTQNSETVKVKILYIPVQFSHSVKSDSLWPHGLQHARPPCPSSTPGAFYS